MDSDQDNLQPELRTAEMAQADDDSPDQVNRPATDTVDYPRRRATIAVRKSTSASPATTN